MIGRRRTRSGDARPVPGIGGSDERSIEGQSALRLHAGIAAVATVLCAFVTAIFVSYGSIPLAVAFGVIGATSLAILFYALRRKRRGEQSK